MMATSKSLGEFAVLPGSVFFVEGDCNTSGYMVEAFCQTGFYGTS